MANMDVKKISDILALKSGEESEVLPIDRRFVERYLNVILSVDKKEFILENLERANMTYTVSLFLSIPELWEEITVDDLVELSERFTNPMSFFCLILFTYKYVEVNTIELLLRLNSVSSEEKKEIKNFIKNQYTNFLKDDFDRLLFQDGVYGRDRGIWMYLKQKLLLDTRVKPAYQTIRELQEYVESGNVFD